MQRGSAHRQRRSWCTNQTENERILGADMKEHIVTLQASPWRRGECTAQLGPDNRTARTYTKQLLCTGKDERRRAQTCPAAASASLLTNLNLPQYTPCCICKWCEALNYLP
jgi:hypothetical protein